MNEAPGPQYALVRLFQLQSGPAHCRIAAVKRPRKPQRAGRSVRVHRSGFNPDALVVVTLGNPREKFWGVLLELDAAGVAVRGIDLTSLDDFAQMLKSGDSAVPGTVFFPMHRVERMELDCRNGPIASIAEEFEQKTGRSAAKILGLSQR